MKGFLFFLTLFFFHCTYATTYYISPSGSDATGTGTSTNPWKTLYKATSSVSGIGDIIHVNSGTYVETQQCSLAVGVSIEGNDSTGTILRSTLTADWIAMLVANSTTEGINGNQHISNIKFDGSNLATFWAVTIIGRKNFSIHDCSFTNFKNRAVIFSGRVDNNNAPPTIYATGNTFYNNTVNNCAGYDQALGYGAGALNIGGQDGMLIYNNVMTQNSRPAGFNGWLIKYWDDGYLNGCKIYNNTLHKILNSYPLGANNWDFAIELFNESGLEIYNNVLDGGSIDMNFQTKGAYAYSVWIHNNSITMPVLNSGSIQTGITSEFSSKDIIIEDNIIDKVTVGINFTPRGNDTVQNITIRRNLITGVGTAESTGFLIDFGGGGGGAQTNFYKNIDVYNNTMVIDPTHATSWGIFLPHPTAGYVKNVHIKNNVIANAAFGALVENGTGLAIDSLNIDNNDIYGNGNSNNPAFNGAAPTHYTYLNNLHVTPQFVGGSNYTLQATSPLIDAGTNVGLAYNGSAPDIGYAEYGSTPPNVAPTANAGVDQTITLPTSSVNLTGSGTDTDGTIASYQWTKISGPTSGVITTPTSAATSVTALVQGVYKFELKVTDNGGAVGRDTMQVTVNPAANIPPTANAGADQTITLPISVVTLTGTGTDTDGTIASYQWTKVSGPAAIMVTPGLASTLVTTLVQGVYKFELKVTDNNGATGTDTVQVNVNAANIPPTANAGTDISITLPTNTVTLSGSGNDPDGTIASYKWTKVSGPAAGTITTSTAASTSVTGLAQGVYLFELKVTDNSGATGTDTVQVTVNPAANIPPTANAGADISITLPTNTVTLSGSGNDPDGTIASYKWTKVSGPAAGTITTSTAASTSVTALAQGVYLFELKVTDNSGATGTDTVQITVNPAANIPPTANAGTDISITLPTNTVTLSGSGNDPDGTIASYKWTKVSGPAAGTITTSTAASTSVTALAQGVYLFELKVTDNSGATGTDTVQITVNPAANIPPTANAGTDISITLPTNTVTLSGSGNDPDGTIASYKWTKVSGPAAGTITTSTAASTSVTTLAQGVYLFELKVTDNSGATGTDTVQVTVNPAPNVPPTANAGIDISITLPVNTVTLSGSGNDPDGSIVSYQWTRISGPAAGNITNAGAASTTVTALIAGIYNYQLTVTDNSGATATDVVQVIVFAPNIPPTADAGLDQSITLPTNTANLTGSGTDVDGTIVSYKWVKISGPAAGTIANANIAVTSVTGLTAGIYIFQLTVTDNNGATATNQMQVTVNAANIPPVANAGADQTITLPVNTVTLTGTGTDVDGTVVAYRWKLLSGPADKLTTPNSAVTVLTDLIQGTYQFELTVTDNKGATGVDVVMVTVNGAVPPPTNNTAKIYPNPVTDFTTLEINNTVNNSTVLITVTDVQGRVVYTKKLPIAGYNAKERLDMRTFAKGAYFVTVNFDSQNKQTLEALKAN